VITDADNKAVLRALTVAAPLALALAAPLAVPAVTAPPATSTAARAPVQDADVERLQAELEAVTARAAELADALDAAAARDGGLRVQLDRLAERQDAARAEVAARARDAYIRTAAAPDPLAGVIRGLTSPGLRSLADAELARRGAAAAVRAEQALADAVAEQSAAARALQERATVFRAQLRAQADEVLVAQERARRLLDEAERALAARRAEAATVAAARVRLAATRTVLDDVSATVTKALTPAQTRRSVAAAVREAPIVALVEAAGAGYPQGYAPTGQMLQGEASWYGPGFVGNPTASGSPYDPERLTCAHKSLPLGTVVRVSRGPLAISCLVNDRGPYVGDRILDLSRAGSRALGFDGVAQVTVEVLAPV
jgi:rare lipoprotein A